MKYAVHFLIHCDLELEKGVTVFHTHFIKWKRVLGKGLTFVYKAKNYFNLKENPH